ncbi:PQQ-dependent sugar dehydrogenase [Actinomadura rudentiformis]|uniref:PQQ-dependent sugar dehydrogenase n=1 Tax=Actinomadura rudentiformis TaxID=359158 RepID=A0A6H9YDS7_9ACTN|nr:PQQ-dependent sugar dehydrogenase [Actinomadura rudentiformis]KAB2342408.1 PQQ-dependent sugar dehydrogenase [Actinomadura rudentiformis]
MRRTSALATVVTVLLVLGACSGDDDGSDTSGDDSPTAADSAQPSSSPTGTARPGEPQAIVKNRKVTWGLAFLPGGDALVTERESAKLLRVTPKGRVTEIGKIPGVSAAGEGGLLGVAVSPGYETDKFVYVYFTARSDNRIARFPYEDGIGRLQMLVTGIPKGDYHNGGRLAFGPDRMLYASTGEAGRENLSQDKKSLGGKILRMTPAGDPAPGNPFGTLVWTYGHRNVQGLAWDPQGRMFATEFGQDRFDEINQIVKGRNYGWPDVEGMGGDEVRFKRPVLTWTPSEASPSGLTYAQGSLWAAALRGKRLWQIPLSRNGTAGRPIAHFKERFGRVREVVPAPDGKSLWLTTDNGDKDGVIVVPLT